MTVSFDVSNTAVARVAAYFGWTGTPAQIAARFTQYVKETIRQDLRNSERAARHAAVSETNIESQVEGELP